MTITFTKYQGTGNDFVLIDNRSLQFPKRTEVIAQLCHRHLGIGADGLMLLENAEGYDFRMLYYNSDGRESSMCGNGGRCIIQFAAQLGLIRNWGRFMAIDGPHTGEILSDGTVMLHMSDVHGLQFYDTHVVLDTGSPHYVQFVSDVRSINVLEQGRTIRYNNTYAVQGINVNFVEEVTLGKIFVRTYERGVEDETMSCGTGVVAAALAYVAQKKLALNLVQVETPGGNLQVGCKQCDEGFCQIYLSGAALKVFEGQIAFAS